MKQKLSVLIDEKREELAEQEMQAKIESEKIDITLPGRSCKTGNLHPLTLVNQELEDLFIGLGYQVIEGPDITDDEYCFERANIPKVRCRIPCILMKTAYCVRIRRLFKWMFWKRVHQTYQLK